MKTEPPSTPDHRCPECGTVLMLVDPERMYAVVKGDCERRVFIEQEWYCSVCMVGLDVCEEPTE